MRCGTSASPWMHVRLRWDIMTVPLTLHGQEESGADDGNEVERQVHEIPNDGLRGELLKGSLRDLAELGHGIASAGFDLTTLGDEVGHVTRYQSLSGEQCVSTVAISKAGFSTEVYHTPSKVSSRASSMRKFLLRSVMMVELSLRVSKMLDRTAIGPLKMERMAACGR